MAAISLEVNGNRRAYASSVNQPVISAPVLSPVPRAFLDLLTGGVVLVDENGHIAEINSEALKLLRCTLSTVQGRDFWDAVPEDVAERHQSVAGKVLAHARQHVFVAHNEFEGSWIEFVIRPHAAGYIVNMRDVTADQKLTLQQNEGERYNQLIFNANPNAMWIFDVTSLNILEVNQAAVEFYAIPRKAFLQLDMGDLFPDGEGAALLSTLGSGKSAVSGSNEAHLSAQLCKQKKGDGQLVLVELACGRVNWNGHKTVLVSIADVAERHLADRGLRRENAALEEALARLQSELKKSNRDLTAFTYGLSHDLQGPLHAANGFATMLGDKYAAALDNTGRHYVSRIQASIRQLARLVDDLRTLVQLPPLSRALERIDLSAVCDTLINDLHKRNPGRVVSVEMAPGLSLVADKRLMVTALASLLDNAWKFTSKKSEGWIRVALLTGQAPGELVLQVSDNGTGFDVAYSAKLFTAFQRLHSSADFPGNGLGLAIVKSVAERHGGRVWAETDATGASFFMALPPLSADVLN